MGVLTQLHAKLVPKLVRGGEGGLGGFEDGGGVVFFPVGPKAPLHLKVRKK